MGYGTEVFLGNSLQRLMSLLLLWHQKVGFLICKCRVSLHQHLAL
jgi:hypothetical protein